MQAIYLISIIYCNRVSTVIEFANRFNSRRGRRRPAVRLAEAIESPPCNVIYLFDLIQRFIPNYDCIKEWTLLLS